MNVERTPTAERVRELLSYEPDTGILRWRVDRKGKAKVGVEAGHVDLLGYRIVSIDNHPYKAHRIAWLVTHGIHPRWEIDHINGCRTDNRMANRLSGFPCGFLPCRVIV